jgi:hypothetical protein
MSAARKNQDEVAVEIQRSGEHASGEHAIELDRLIRNTFEDAFEADLQSTSRVSKFELEGVLSNPEVRPTEPPKAPPIVGMPIVNVVPDEYDAISVGSLPPPAIEIAATKEEEREP